jgi:hypothetical protein
MGIGFGLGDWHKVRSGAWAVLSGLANCTRTILEKSQCYFCNTCIGCIKFWLNRVRDMTQFSLKSVSYHALFCVSRSSCRSWGAGQVN